MKVSFDYDNTITQIRVQLLAMELIDGGDEVYIISARSNPSPIWRIADKLKIPRSRVFATGSNKAKVEKVKELGIQRHYDDNPDVIGELGKIGKLVG